MKDIVIYGFGGLATGDITWLIDEINHEGQIWNLIGFLDDNIENKGKEKNGFKVLGDAEWLDQHGKNVYCAIGIGKGTIREKIVENIKDKVSGFPSLIHPNASISRHAIVGAGSIICGGCLISGNVNIGSFVILNLGCTIGHDALINDFSIVAPGAHVSGNVQIGKYADIGTGVTVIQGITIGEGSIIGASAAVVRDIPPYCTAVGVPAKIIKRG